jgi:membrane dipeptidase
MPIGRGPWIDIHAHPGRSFLAGFPADHPMTVVLGGDGSPGALASARAAELTAVSFATVADLLVLAPKPDGGLHAGRPFHPGEAYEDHQRQLRGLHDLVASDGATLARTADDLERAHRDGDTAVLVTCEGGDFLEGHLGRVGEAQDQGMSSLTLVHYRVNELGDIQTEPAVHDGLTAFGRAVVQECNRLGVVVDCAHATLHTTRDVLEVSSSPVMISHSHLDHADRPHPRLLSTDHARAVADAGGLVGAWPAGVTSQSLEDYVDEILRLIDTIGTEHVAIGTDLDANYQPVLTEHGQLAEVAARLEASGLSASETDLVLGGNVVALYRVVAG